MKQIILLSIYLLASSVSFSQQSQKKTWFTYTELKEGAYDQAFFIEKLTEKDFIVISHSDDEEQKLAGAQKNITMAYDYNSEKETALIWVEIWQHSYIAFNATITVQFSNNTNYNYIISRIKEYCKKISFEYDSDYKSYVYHYLHPDGTHFTFLEKGNTYVIRIYDKGHCPESYKDKYYED